MSDAIDDRMPLQRIPTLLKGQKALVTGANSGMGKAIAIALGEAGADVAVNYVVGDSAAQEVVETIIAPLLACDLSDYITGASIFVDGGMTLYPEFSTGG